MKKLTLALLSSLLTLAFVTPAFAQDTDRSINSYNREVAVQYSVLRDIGEMGAGILVDFGKALKPGISLVGEFNLNRFSSMEESYTQVAGGVRFGRMAGSRSRVFAQVMAGPQTSFGSTGFAIQPGVGLNTKMGRRVDAKFQVDFPIVKWEGETYKQVRVSVGLGLPFGSR